MKQFTNLKEIKKSLELCELSNKETSLTYGGMALLYAIRPPYETIIDIISKFLK